MGADGRGGDTEVIFLLCVWEVEDEEVVRELEEELVRFCFHGSFG